MSVRGGRSFGGSPSGRAVALFALLVAPTLLALAPVSEAQRPGDPWWGPASRAAPTDGWAIRVPVTVENDRTYFVENQTVAVELDFTAILKEAGWTTQTVGADERLRGFTLDVDSIRVVEYARGFSGGPIHGASTQPIPHAFYPALLDAPRTRDFDAARNPAGTVVFPVEGSWGPQVKKFFYVYANPLEYGDMEPLSLDTAGLRKAAPIDGFLWSTTGTTVYGFEPQQSNQNHRVHVRSATSAAATTVTMYKHSVGRFEMVQGTSQFPNPVTLAGFNSASFLVPPNTAWKIVADHPITVAAHGNGQVQGSGFVATNETQHFVPSLANSFVGRTFSLYGFSGLDGIPGAVTVMKTGGGLVTVTSLRSGQSVRLDSAEPAKELTVAQGWDFISATGDILVTGTTASRLNLPFQPHDVPAITGGPAGTEFLAIVPGDGGYSRMCAAADATLRIVDQAKQRQLVPEDEGTTRLLEAGCAMERANAAYPTLSPVQYLSTVDPAQPVEGAPVPFRLEVGTEGRQKQLDRDHVGQFAGYRGVQYNVSGPIGLFGVYPDTKVTIQEKRDRDTPITTTINLAGDSYRAWAGSTDPKALKEYQILATKPIVVVSIADAEDGRLAGGHPYSVYYGGRPLELATTVGPAQVRGPLVDVRAVETDARQVFRSTGPSTAATFTLEAVNLGRWIGGDDLTDEIEISCLEVPETWKVEGCSRRVRLASGAAERLDVSITPDEESVNQTVTIPVVARSVAGNVSATIRLIVHVEIRYGLGMWFDVEGGRKSIDPPVGLDPGETHRYNVVVKNTGSALDRFRFEVESPREGWTQSLLLRGDPVTAPVPLEGGQSVTLQFVVEAPDTETAQQNLVRITGQSLSNALAADTVNTATRIRPKVDVRLDLEPPTRVARPNETAVFNLTLLNSGNDIFRITLRDDTILPEGWTSALEVDEVDLGPGQPFTFELRMTPPAGARAGDLATAKIAAEIDAGDGGGSVAGDEVSAVTVVRKVHNLTATPLPDVVAPSGETLDYVLPILNAGNGPETVEVLPGAASPAWRVTADVPELPIDLGASGELPLEIDVPFDTPPGAYELTFTVRLSREEFQNLTIPIEVAPTPRLEFQGVGDLALLPGSPREIDATVRNAGNVEREFVFGSEAPAGWNVTYEPASASLAPGESIPVRIVVNASRAAADGAYAVEFTADAEGARTVAARLARPDLYLAGVQTSGRLRAGDLVLVSAEVGNRGDATADNVTVALVVDGLAVDQVVLNRVLANESKVATLSWLATGTPGTVEVRIDPQDALVELSDEGNAGVVQFGSRLGVPGLAPLALLAAAALLALALRRRSL